MAQGLRDRPRGAQRPRLPELSSPLLTLSLLYCVLGEELRSKCKLIGSSFESLLWMFDFADSFFETRGAEEGSVCGRELVDALGLVLLANSMDQSERYDRQIRLWGEKGQIRLEEAHVCVINASALGTETLKNLVLPGIGAFSLIDGKKCTTRDLGRNFFVTKEQVNNQMYRAEAASALLRDLNDAVEGNFLVEDIEDIVERTEDMVHFVQSYSLVITAGLPYGSVLEKVASACNDAAVPLIVCRVYGLIGIVRVIIPELCIENTREGVESKTLRNLSLSNPFPELIQHAEGVDLDALDDTQHAHVPYVVLLVKVLLEWRRERGDAPVATRDDLETLRGMLRSKRRTKDEENFAEALKKVFLLRSTTNGHELPADLDDAKVLHPKGAAREGSNQGFWLLLSALQRFARANKGRLPIRAELPDMASDTDSYIRLQRVYRAKAAADISMVMDYTKQIAAERGVEVAHESVVKYFCHNSAYLKIIRTRTFKEEMTSHTTSLAEGLKDPEGSAHFYLYLRAIDRLASQHLGAVSTMGEQSLAALRTEANRILSEIGFPAGAVNLWDEGLLELLRYDGCELHSVAALVGGIVAQESVKLLTRQFVPIDNMVVYNGGTGATTRLQL